MLPGLIVYGWAATPFAAGGALPCLWRLLLGFPCPGCGLSRANALFLRGSIREALAMNWLVLPLWAIAIWSFIQVFAPTILKGTSWLNSAPRNSRNSSRISTTPRS
ncbi:DUF2752 domain-containing protein [Longimicrobium terrae]|nr:DUF2752 domain-containing protein [Longimicrobium terrae]